MRAQTYVISAIIFVIIVSVFAVMNVESVEVNYIFWKGQSPLILVILFSVLMGGLITAAATTVKLVRINKNHKALVKENTKLKNVLVENDIEFESSEVK